MSFDGCLQGRARDEMSPGASFFRHSTGLKRHVGVVDQHAILQDRDASCTQADLAKQSDQEDVFGAQSRCVFQERIHLVFGELSPFIAFGRHALAGDFSQDGLQAQVRQLGGIALEEPHAAPVHVHERLPRGRAMVMFMRAPD